jgi:hypothetical protein
MRRFSILGIIGLGLGSVALAAEPTPAEWIEKLSSPRPNVREQAMKFLEFSGEPALTLLRKAAASEDIDVAQRASLVLGRIEKTLENRKHLEVKRYSFKFEDEMIRSVATNLTRTLKITVHLDEKKVSNPKRTVSFEVKDATAFEVLSKFMEVAELKENDSPTPNPQANQGRRNAMIWDGRGYINGQPQDFTRLVLMDGKPDSPTFNTGPLRIRLVNGKDGAVKSSNTNEIGFKLDVFSNNPTSWRGLLGVDIKKAIDEHGQNLTQSYITDPTAGPQNLYDETMIFNGGGFLQVQGAMMLMDIDSGMPGMGSHNPRHLPITLFGGKKPSKKLVEVEGVIHGRMLTPPATLATIDDVSKVSLKEIYRSGNTTLQIMEVNLKPANKGQQPYIRYKITTAIDFSAMNNPWGAQFGGGLMVLDDLGLPNNGTQPQLTLRDNAGNVVRTTPQINQHLNDGMTQTIEAQLNFSPLAVSKAPLKLSLVGQKEVEISVPFTLKNIQLP